MDISKFDLELFLENGFGYTRDDKRVDLLAYIPHRDKKYLVCNLNDFFDNGGTSLVVYNEDGIMLPPETVKKSRGGHKPEYTLDDKLILGFDAEEHRKTNAYILQNNLSGDMLSKNEITMSLDNKNITCKKTSLHVNFNHVMEEWSTMDFDITLGNGKNLQRPLVWTLEQKQMFIKNLFTINSPCLNFVYIVSRDKPTGSRIIQVVDGKQRLHAMKDFYEGKFPIVHLGKEFYYENLTFMLKFNFNNVHMESTVYYEYTYDQKYILSDKDRVSIFENLNFTGTVQDIEHLKSIKEGFNY